MDEPNICSYCNVIIDSDDFLVCSACSSNVHVKCLQRPGTPGDLHGDVFFDFVCIKCSGNQKEQFTRIRLPWLMIIALAIYNLSIHSKGLGRHGFFHWRTHIAFYIEKNWDFLFPPETKRKKKWTGTVSGTLSHNSPDFFISGQEIFHDSGWWKLTYNQTPKFYFKLYEQLSHKRQLLRNDKKVQEESCYSSDISNGTSEDIKRKLPEVEEEFSRSLPYMGRPPKKFKKHDAEPNKDLNLVQSSLMDFIAANLSNDDLLLSDDLPDIATTDFLPLIGSNNADILDLDGWSDDIAQMNYNLENNDTNQYEPSSDANDSMGEVASFEPEEEKYKPRIVQITNFQHTSVSSTQANIKKEVEEIKQEIESLSENENDAPELICEKSLFTVTPKRDFPWKEEGVEDEDRGDEEICANMEIMSEYEEKELYKQLKNILSVEKECNIKVPTWIRRFYRKLCIRVHKRGSSKPIFDLDNFGSNKLENTAKTNILDRYHHIICNSTMKDDCSFHARICGAAHYDIFESPHTSRILHPYIYRSTKCFPPWVKLMCELQYAVKGEVPSRASVDFCYVRPYHIAAVNALLQLLFWPGIDMSECLSYPEFSVVALYKKLVIGCAFLVPDVCYNEAYISFMAVRPGWQRCGIATFMLYHLTQTCMGKDITLHVSASNSAVCLYQKFGFKIEEVILDFYDKYLPVDSTQSRNAFFLRLTR